MPLVSVFEVINAVSRRYFLQANDVTDMRDWVAALNRASKITVPKSGPAPPRSDVTTVISDTQGGKRQQAYKTEIIGGVVVHTPIQVIKWKLKTNVVTITMLKLMLMMLKDLC